MIKAIMLDFDGVILESVDVKTEAFRELFSRYTDDTEPAIAYHLANNAMSRFPKFRYIWKEILGRHYDDSVRDELGREFSNIVADRVVKCPFVLGASDFLKKFYKKVPLYIASLVPLKELELIVSKKGVRHYFKNIYGFPPTTKTEAMDEVMKGRSIKPDEILYIGDSIQDLKAAKEKGVRFVARKNKDNFNDQSVPVFEDMEEIAVYITENLELRDERRRHT